MQTFKKRGKSRKKRLSRKRPNRRAKKTCSRRRRGGDGSCPNMPVKDAKATGIVKRKHTGVQAHGHEWEDDLIAIFVSPSDMDEMDHLSYTAVHDIPKELNQLTQRNVSVKATKTNRVDFGDALRTLDNMTGTSPLEAVIIQYKQDGSQKVPSRVVRLDLTEAKKVLFGDADIDEIKSDFRELDSMVKTGVGNYKTKAAEIRRKMADSHMKVAPKIGNLSKKRAGRLQISLGNIDKLIEQNPHLVIQDEHCDPIKGCLRTLESSVRTIGKKPSKKLLTHGGPHS